MTWHVRTCLNMDTWVYMHDSTVTHNSPYGVFKARVLEYLEGMGRSGKVTFYSRPYDIWRIQYISKYPLATVCNLPIVGMIRPHHGASCISEAECGSMAKIWGVAHLVAHSQVLTLCGTQHIQVVGCRARHSYVSPVSSQDGRRLRPGHASPPPASPSRSSSRWRTIR